MLGVQQKHSQREGAALHLLLPGSSGRAAALGELRAVSVCTAGGRAPPCTRPGQANTAGHLGQPLPGQEDGRRGVGSER